MLFQATKHREKYYHLIKLLEDMGILITPDGLQERVFSSSKRGVNKLISGICVVEHAQLKNQIVFIKPSGNGPGIINFQDILDVASKYNDPVSTRFCESLKLWQDKKAGSLPQS